MIFSDRSEPRPMRRRWQYADAAGVVAVLLRGIPWREEVGTVHARSGVVWRNRHTATLRRAFQQWSRCWTDTEACSVVRQDGGA
jgi:hypothetical protein